MAKKHGKNLWQKNMAKIYGIIFKIILSFFKFF